MDNLSLFIKPEMIRETEIILKIRNDNDKGESNKYLDVSLTMTAAPLGFFKGEDTQLLIST